MRILYECEKVAVLQEDETFIVHILDNYRMVKEIKTNRKNLFSILKVECCNTKFHKKITFGKKMRKPTCETCDIEKMLRFI